MIYFRNKKCNTCDNDVIYYIHAKKLACNCGDVEAVLSKRMLTEQFKPFDEVLIKKGA